MLCSALLSPFPHGLTLQLPVYRITIDNLTRWSKKQKKAIRHSLTSARKDLFNYAMADGYAKMFKEAGFEDEITELREKQINKDREGALSAISDKMIQAIDFIGTAAEVKDFVDSYIKAGVEQPILMPMPWGDNRMAVTKATMEAAISASQLD